MTASLFRNQSVKVLGLLGIVLYYICCELSFSFNKNWSKEIDFTFFVNLKRGSNSY